MEESIKTVNSGEQFVAAGPAGGLPADDYIWENYRLRRNVLSGKDEYRVINEDDSQFRVLTEHAKKSIILQSRRDGYTGKYDITQDLKLIFESDDIPHYDPIISWLNGLQWDGKERLVDFWKRIPGITAEQIYFFTKWMRGMVAQWLEINKEHGNECVVLFIGKQGCGKSTFFRRMLPEHLRDYYIDSFKLSNQFDKDMTLTNNLLLNMDEFDKYGASQQAQIKQALSVVKVNARRIFGRAQEVFPRKATFVATTNCKHPLHDQTGSRRYLCISIPVGEFIDNITPIEYEQIYAQLVAEVFAGECYWFTNDEVQRIQLLNAPFQSENSLEEMVDCCVSHIEEGQQEEYLSTDDIILKMKETFPNADHSKFLKSVVGRTMRSLGFAKKHTNKKELYIAKFRKAS